MLTIVAALNDEIRLIKAEMEVDKAIHMRPFSIFTGKYQNKKIGLVRAGLGKEATRIALTYFLENLKPSLIINIGYAGGLDPHLHTGDIVLANSVIDEATEKIWPVDEKLILDAERISEAAGLRHHTGKMVTVDRALTDPHDKAFIGTRFEAIACEMESVMVANLSSNAKVPFFVARSIIDSLDIELPEIPEKAVISGKIRIGPLMKHLRSRPQDILKLPKFSYLANQARISMTNFVREWIKHEQNL